MLMLSEQAFYFPCKCEFLSRHYSQTNRKDFVWSVGIYEKKNLALYLKIIKTGFHTSLTDRRTKGHRRL